MKLCQISTNIYDYRLEIGSSGKAPELSLVIVTGHRLMCFRYLRITRATSPVTMPTATDSSGMLRRLDGGGVAFVDVLVELVTFEATVGPPRIEMTPVDVTPFNVKMRLVPLTRI